MKSYRVIGQGLPRIESAEKATGEAKYVADLKLPRMLFGKILRSPHAHARIMNINTDKARKMPGVKVVLTGRETLGIKIGALSGSRDRQLIAVEKVRFIGEAVAAVAAVDEDTAQDALDLIEVEYEALPAVFTVEEALKDSAPRVHENIERNIAFERRWNFGDVEKAFLDSDYVREDRFTTSIVLHGFIEPTGCLAAWEPSGKYTLWLGSQMPFTTRRDLALALGVPEGRVRVIKVVMGGGFGGKTDTMDLYLASALMARQSGRPVKIEYTMKEQFMAGSRRIPLVVDLKTGVKRDGTLVAQESKVMTDGGAYVSAGAVTIYNHGLAHMIPYRLPNFRYEAYRIYTNKPFCGPKRGHGQNQIRFAVESQLDMIAEELGIDPVEIRLKNALQPGDVTVNGLKINTCGLSETIRQAAGRAGWKEKKGKGNGVGVGIGCGGFSSGVRNAALSDAAAMIKLNEDGGVVLFTGAADMGQGCNTILGQIVAEVLGIDLKDVTVIAGDTETCPYTPGAVGSTTTWYAGNAVKLCAEDVRKQIAEVVAARFKANMDEIEFYDHQVFLQSDPEKKMPFVAAVRAAQVSDAKGVIIGRATYYPPGIEWPDPNRSYAGNISGGYSFSTQVAEVEVDKGTGKVLVKKMYLVDDCGFPLNPLSCEGQAQGSASNAQGEMLFEELVMDRGRIVNCSFEGYKMPTAIDSPQFENETVITNEPGGPFGAKEIGEGFILSGFGAIANAIHDATGIWVKDLPITSEKILKALKEKEKGG